MTDTRAIDSAPAVNCQLGLVASMTMSRCVREPHSERCWWARPSTLRRESAVAAIVLVHGAWTSGWIWKKIIPLLRSAGHDVYATTATGVGDRAHLAVPAVDLDTHITDVANVLEFEDLTDVTLVG